MSTTESIAPPPCHAEDEVIQRMAAFISGELEGVTDEHTIITFLPVELATAFLKAFGVKEQT